MSDHDHTPRSDARSPHSHRPRAWPRVLAVLLAAGAASLALPMLAPGADGGLPKIDRSATRAHAARTFTLNESAHLRLTSKHGFTLNERGGASGTITGTIYVHLRIVSTSRVTAEINIYPRGGSVSGYATAGYHKGNQTASFSGLMSIVRGTGSYGGAHGSNLSFSGTIQRSNDAVTVHMSGRVST